jgi:Protein of unknown function (DUF3558)
VAANLRISRPRSKPGLRLATRLLVCSLAALLVAGCSSSAASPTVPGNGGSQGASPSQAAPASQAPSASQAAAAGASAAQGGQNLATNLCAVWTQAQVDAAGGGSLGPGVPQNGGQMCLWQNQTNASISISSDSTGSGATYDDICTASDPMMVKVDGVGDGACYLVAGNIGTQLIFKKGSNSYTVAIQRIDVTVDKVEALEKTLALAAAAKL